MSPEDRDFLKAWLKSMLYAVPVVVIASFLAGWGICAALGYPYW